MFKEFIVNHIVVPVDFSDTGKVAVDHAVEIAKRFKAEITVVHVLESGAFSGIIAPSKKTEFEERELAQKELQDFAHALEKEHGLDVSQLVKSGRVNEEIREAAKDVGADLIVMGTHGVTGWAEFFVGSNAYRVVTGALCPVLTIQEHSKTIGYQSIILPLDATPSTLQKVPYAAGIAKLYGATIHIACLISEDEPEVRAYFEKRLAQVMEYLEKEEVQYTKATLVGENLATMTMNHAEAKEGDLIVMMTEQEERFTGLLMGPFAQQIVNHSRIPVMSISPEELTITDDSFHALG